MPAGLFHRQRFILLKLDKSIDILDTVNLPFIDQGFLKTLLIIKYTPKLNQACYNNVDNGFPVTKEQRNLLIESNILDVRKKVDITQISKSLKFDPESKLTSFDSEYLIFDRFMAIPFSLKLNIRVERTLLRIRSDLHYNYLYSRNPPVRFTKFLINICPKGAEPNLNFCFYQANIITKNSFLTTPFTGNQRWHREEIFPLTYILSKNNFHIKAAWTSSSLTREEKGVFSEDYSTKVIPLNGEFFEAINKIER